VLAEDSDPAWVEVFGGVPVWWSDRLVRIADRAGARSLVVGDDVATPASMYVRSVCGTGPKGVTFTASTGDPTSVSVHRWSPSGLIELTAGTGVHTAAGSGETVVLVSHDMERVGPTVSVRVADGAARTLTSRALPAPPLPGVRWLSLGVRSLRAGLVLPRDHRPGTRLPVLMDPYGGPSAQRVVAAARSWLEPQWLADQGFAVLVVDGRGTQGRDPVWEREIHRDFASLVLADQVDALQAAAEIEPDLDLSRVGIRGWSFGGYLAALAVLRRPDVFHAAVAGAPVTDWSRYDTFYTERYLGTPQRDPQAYAVSSLLDDAPNLSRPLLLIHGLADDNVAAAHTLGLSQRLTEAGRPHSVLPLTGVTHMTPQESVAENLLLLQVEFLHRHLG
jgi:dipeptidyl-peptidase-4